MEGTRPVLPSGDAKSAAGEAVGSAPVSDLHAEVWAAFYDVEERSMVPVLRWQRLERAIEALTACPDAAAAENARLAAEVAKLRRILATPTGDA